MIIGRHATMQGKQGNISYYDATARNPWNKEKENDHNKEDWRGESGRALV
jgi:hypothetical protein